MLCAPVIVNGVLKLVLPAASVPVPSVIRPSLKVTVPLGVCPVTFAVSVVASPMVVGLGVALTVVLC